MRKMLFACTAILVTSLASSVSARGLLPAPQGEPPPACAGGSTPVCTKESCGGLPVSCSCAAWQCQQTNVHINRGGIVGRFSPRVDLR